MATKAYKYGLPGLVEGGDEVWRQIRLSNNYYNALIEHEVGSRSTKRVAMAQFFGPLYVEAAMVHDALWADVRSLGDEVKLLRGHGADVEADEAEARLEETKGRAKEAKAGLKAMREADPAGQARWKEWKEAARMDGLASIRSIRGRYGRNGEHLSPGTYMRVEDAWSQSCETTVWYKDPRFRPLSRSQCVAIWFQGGAPVSELHSGTNLWIHVAPPPPGAFDPSVPRGERRRLSRTTLRMRVATIHTEGGRPQPVWAEWRMIMHRPLPEDGVVTGVSVHRRKDADRDRWEVVIIVRTPDVAHPVRSGEVGIDIGWRSASNDEMRAAYWSDDQGRHGELVLPGHIRHRIFKADAIRSGRDLDMEKMRASLLPILGGIEDPSEELAAMLSHAHSWKSPARFVTLLRRHGDELPPEAASLLETWRRRDLHLWQMETGMRRGAQRARLDFVRKFAHDFVRRYGVIKVEDFDLDRAARRPARAHRDAGDAGDAGDGREAALRKKGQRQRVVVAPHEMRMALRQAAAAVGSRVVKVERAGTTRQCHLCGHDEPWKDPFDRWHTCGGCGARWDRDRNASVNILRRPVSTGEPVVRHRIRRNRKAPARPAEADRS